MNSSQKHIIVVGSGRLATRIQGVLHNQHYAVRHITQEHIEHVHHNGSRKSMFDTLTDILKEAGIAEAYAAYVVDEEDRNNIHALLTVSALHINVPIFVALSNDGLASHLRSGHHNFHVRNVGKIVAPIFVDALRDSVAKSLPAPQDGHVTAQPLFNIRTDHIMHRLVGVFLSVILGGMVFFHATEHLSWLNSFYYIATVITSVNFNDVAVRNHAAGTEFFRIIMMLGIQAFMLVTFSLIIDQIIKRRTETLILGRKRYAFSNHVIVCGMGRVGFPVVQELLHRGEKVLVIEKNPDNPFLETARSHGAAVLIGDASLFKNLHDAGIQKAAGLISVISDDLKNLEIGLNARSLRPSLRLILRVFDQEVADEMRNHLNIHFAYSTSAIAAQEFVNLLETK